MQDKDEQNIEKSKTEKEADNIIRNKNHVTLEIDSVYQELKVTIGGN